MSSNLGITLHLCCFWKKVSSAHKCIFAKALFYIKNGSFTCGFCLCLCFCHTRGSAKKAQLTSTFFNNIVCRNRRAAYF